MENGKLNLGKSKEAFVEDVALGDLVEAINDCKGDVFLETAEGDKINLKSQFCRMIGLLNIIEGGRFAGAKLVCEKEEDASKLFRFNLYGRK